MRLLKCASLLLVLFVGGASASAAEDTHNNRGGWLDRICSKDNDDSGRAEWAQHRADRLAERLKLTDAQKTAFKDVADTRAKLRADHKAELCANRPDLSTLEKRLAFRQARLEARLADMKVETPKLLAFVSSLDDQQKAEFDEMVDGRRGRGDDGDRGEDRHHRHHHDDQE
jgi:Spy/CpxP family protein refolding chaperone